MIFHSDKEAITFVDNIMATLRKMFEILQIMHDTKSNQYSCIEPICISYTPEPSVVSKVKFS